MKAHLSIVLFISFIFLFSKCKEEENNKIKIFWSWFNKNQKEFHLIDSSNQEEKLNIIIEHLNPITKELSVEISKEQNGIRNLTISPEGDTTKFKLVKEIILNAPKIEGWTFTAFRQPYYDDFIIEYENIKFNTKEMYFLPEIDKDTLDLIIFSQNKAEEDSNEVNQYGLITMDKILGEYDCTMKVRYFTFLNTDEANDKKRLIPVSYLRTFVDSFYKSKTK